MHDPMTLAHSIRRPWPSRLRDGWRYWPNLVTIWHVDPQTDDSDDSCGWAFPRLTPAHLALIEELVEEERAFPFFTSPSIRASSVIVDARYAYHQLPPGDCLALTHAAWLWLAWRVERRRLTPRDLVEIANLATCHNDNLRASLVDPQEKDEELFRSFLCAVLRNYLRFRRPWYKHPRWHLHHWKITIEPLLTLKRWLWTRCMHCGKRFRWGESPVTSQWDNEGPRWFRGESQVSHSKCYEARLVPISLITDDDEGSLP